MLGTMREISAACDVAHDDGAERRRRICACSRAATSGGGSPLYDGGGPRLVSRNELHIPVGVSSTWRSRPRRHSLVLGARAQRKTDMILDTSIICGCMPRARGVPDSAPSSAASSTLGCASPSSPTSRPTSRAGHPRGGARLPPSGAVAEAGSASFTANVCASCTRSAHRRVGLAGPDLTHVGSRRTLAPECLANDDAGARVDRGSAALTSRRIMPRAALRRRPPALVAYLRSLQ